MSLRSSADAMGSAHSPFVPTATSTSTDSSGVDSDSDTSLLEPIQYDSDMLGLPKRGEGFTTRKGHDYRPQSTFYLKPKPTRTLAENICALFYRPNMESMYYIQNIDRGPIPTIGMLAEHAFTIPVGLAPILIQSAAYWAFPNYNWPFAVAYPFYVVAFALFAHGVAERWNRIVMKHGCFDEKNFGRDRTPDTGVKGLARGLIAYMFYRTALTFYLHYESTENPLLSFTITYPLRLVAWLVTFDYFFYAYHRSCHEIPFLWNIHKKHHTTKHPTAILAMLAGDYQECIEIALVPTLASLLIPMSFGELYLTLCYVMAAEAAGHSGARVVTQHPVLFFLKYFGAEMELEDHDLHHRNGKSGRSFGKQGQVWDKLFGTKGTRIETAGM